MTPSPGSTTSTRTSPPPEGGLTPYRRAVALALGKERDGQVETTWASAGADADPLPSDPEWAGHLVYLDERSYSSDVDPKHVWTIIEGIGGQNGWYSMPLAWRVRGWLDKLTGGAGLLRGRRHPHLLAEGEVVDWWRAERIDRGRLLRLRAEMRAPGRAWLELSVEPEGTGSRYRQRAIFFPKGLSGAPVLAGGAAVPQPDLPCHVAEYHGRGEGPPGSGIGAGRAHRVGCWEPETTRSTPRRTPNGIECIHQPSAHR